VKTTDNEYKSTFFLLHCDFDGDIVWSFLAVILSLLTSYTKIDGLHFAPAENFTLFVNGDRLKILKNGAHIPENRNQTGVVMDVLGPLLSSLETCNDDDGGGAINLYKLLVTGLYLYVTDHACMDV
ncbi:hypothetical protein CEXT_773191, partial [Caerostris extrusa]